MSLRQTEAAAALRAALLGALAADPALAALVGGRVHDGAPRAPVTPFLALGETRGREISDGDGALARLSAVLEAATADEDRGRAVAILDRALSVALALPADLGGGRRLMMIRTESTQALRQRDGRGWRAAATLDALVDAAG